MNPIIQFSNTISNKSGVFADIHKSIKLSTSSAFTGHMPTENTLLFRHNSRKGLIPQLIQTEQRQTHGGPEERRTLSLSYQLHVNQRHDSNQQGERLPRRFSFCLYQRPIQQKEKRNGMFWNVILCGKEFKCQS